MNRRFRRSVVSAVAAASIFATMTSVFAVPLQTGLINYWKFDEGAGSTLTDTGPPGISTDNGTLQASPTWLTGRAGKFNGGLQFNGTNRYGKCRAVNGFRHHRRHTLGLGEVGSVAERTGG